MKKIILNLIVILFASSAVLAQNFDPKPNWKDSFENDGFCWCDTNFDHGITSKTVTINNTPYSVVDICDELEKHPSYRDYQNGDPIYNDIQCGNGPFNDAPDEPGCPGRVDLGPSGCFQIGPNWDMDWLASRTRFNGDGNGTGGNGDDDDLGEIGTAGNGGSGQGEGPLLSVIFPTLNKRLTAPATFTVEAEATDADGVQKIELYVDGQLVRTENFAPYLWNDKNQDNALSNLPVKNYFLEVIAYDNNNNVSIVDILVYVIPETGETTIKGQSTNKYVSSNDGLSPMEASSNNAGTSEKFTLEPLGNNVFGIKGSNEKYVSSENGLKEMTCNRNAIGTWERFTLESLGGDLYAIKGNNGKYVSHENGTKPINCNRSNVGTWERFIIEGINIDNLDKLNTADSNIVAKSIVAYPNPALSLADVEVIIDLDEDALTSLEIYNVSGQKISEKSLGNLPAGSTSISLGEISGSLKSSGLYLIVVNMNNRKLTKQVVVEK